MKGVWVEFKFTIHMKDLALEDFWKNNRLCAIL